MEIHELAEKRKELDAKLEKQVVPFLASFFFHSPPFTHPLARWGR